MGQLLWSVLVFVSVWIAFAESDLYGFDVDLTTLAVGNTSDSKALKQLLLVVLHIYADKVAILEKVYRTHFWDILYVAPVAAKGELQRMSVAVHSCEGYNTSKTVAKLRLDTSYPCVGDALSYLIGVPSPSEPKWAQRMRKNNTIDLHGALVVHADFWISPSFFNRRDFGKLWFPVAASESKKHPSHTCTERTKLDMDKWNWWSTELPIYDAVIASLHAAFPLLHINTSRLCRGWSDMYYVPQRTWLAWTRAAAAVEEAFGQPWNVLMNEVAIPLLFDVMVQQGQCEGTGICRVESAKCWGGTIWNTNNITVIKNNPCGHRMNLSSPSIRMALDEVWNQPFIGVDANALRINYGEWLFVLASPMGSIIGFIACGLCGLRGTQLLQVRRMSDEDRSDVLGRADIVTC